MLGHTYRHMCMSTHKPLASVYMYTHTQTHLQCTQTPSCAGVPRRPVNATTLRCLLSSGPCLLRLVNANCSWRVFTGGGGMSIPRERVKPARAERETGGPERRRTGPRSCSCSADGEAGCPRSREKALAGGGGLGEVGGGISPEPLLTAAGQDGDGEELQSQARSERRRNPGPESGHSSFLQFQACCSRPGLIIITDAFSAVPC